VEELIKEYRKSLEAVNKCRFMIADEHSKKLLGNCATSLRYSIEYMEIGKEPGNRRSITNRSYEQRTVPMDPNSYDFLKAAVINKVAQNNLSDEKRVLVDDLLALLTPKQREAFVMVRGNGYSFSQAGKMMKIKETSVQSHVDRAEKKMRCIVSKDRDSNKINVKKPVQCVIFA